MAISCVYVSRNRGITIFSYMKNDNFRFACIINLKWTRDMVVGVKILLYKHPLAEFFGMAYTWHLGSIGFRKYFLPPAGLRNVLVTGWKMSMTRFPTCATRHSCSLQGSGVFRWTARSTSASRSSSWKVNPHTSISPTTLAVRVSDQYAMSGATGRKVNSALGMILPSERYSQRRF